MTPRPIERSPFFGLRAAGPAAVQFEDRSTGLRFGLKGPGAAAWLAARNVALPVGANRWTAQAEGLVARLGRSEFLLEGDWLRALPLQRLPEDVYPVLRRDASLALRGAGVDELLLQTSSFDFSRLGAGELVMTQMIGISIIALREPDDALRLWFDPTFACYVWRTLAAVAAELAGDTTDT